MSSTRFFPAWKRTHFILMTGLIMLAAGCSQLNYQCKVAANDEMSQAKRFFLEGKHRQSLQDCLAIISRYPACAVYDQALYYAALNYVQLNTPDGEYQGAIKYFKRLEEECPGSLLKPGSATWVLVLTHMTSEVDKDQEDPKENGAPLAYLPKGRAIDVKKKDPDKKKDSELKNLRLENEKLKKEIDLLKNVDVQLHQKKRDLNNAESGTDEGKDSHSR